MSVTSQSMSVFMTIQFSIVLLLTTVFSQSAAFLIAVPIIPTSRAIERLSEKSRVMTTTAQYLFAKWGQLESESGSELPLSEMGMDEVYRQQEELALGLVGEGDENDLYNEIVDKTDYLGDQDGWTENKNDGKDQNEDKADESSVEWDVYIDHSKASKDKGAIATLDSFLALSPPKLVQIHPAMLSKTKGKGPTVRCIQRQPPSPPSITTKTTPPPYAFDVNNVNDVDKVYLILTRYMNIPSISTTARSCLKWTYRGNAHLEQQNLPAAIRAYDRALSPNHLHPPHEGVILLLRATAYLKRASHHQIQLRSVVDELNQAVPDPASLGNLFQLARQHPTLANPLFRRFLTETRTMQTQFQQTKYWHGLYEYSLLHAAKDSLRATQLMPESAQAYLRAADSLAELRKLKESVLYYEKAIELDPSLEERIRPVVGRLMRSWDFLERAKAMGWSGDTLRLALDVAG